MVTGGELMRFIEFSGSKTYHYVREGSEPRPYCMAADNPRFKKATVVTERSEPRTLCCNCYKEAFFAAKHGNVKLPPRTDWEREQWQTISCRHAHE